MAQTKNNTKKSGNKSKTTSAAGAKAKEKTKTAPKKEKESAAKAPAKKKESPVRDERDVPQEEGFFSQLTPYFIALFALLLAVCIVAGEGKIGGGIRGILAGLFSGAAYLLPEIGRASCRERV